MRRIIWTCWFQGRNQAPDLVQRCLSSWERNNPEWSFRCLDAHTAGHYVDISDYVDLVRQTITAASLSDILRIALLHEYGGVWVDATTYCNQPIGEWLPLAMGSGFFAFANPAPDRLLASWFLAATPQNELVAKWAKRTCEYWRGRNDTSDYFWFHHQFGELCSVDAEARAAWQRVPKVSADGPHSVQSIGMYESTAAAAAKVDWATPVFKLTHRLDEERYRKGSLVYDLLHRHELAVSAPVAPVKPNVARIAELKVGTENVGDHIQIEAGSRLLSRLGFHASLQIDRDDDIATASQIASDNVKTGILLNGWFKTNPEQWPPHPILVPIYLGFHIRLFQAPTLISEKAIEHYRTWGPMGCRDRYTLSLLRSNGVDAFLSHCLSLTLPRRLPDPELQTETFIVSRDKAIREYLPSDVKAARFISHYSGTTDFASNLEQARMLLQLYRTRAKLIITTMLHCALPAIAMGIPVVVFYPVNEGDQHVSDRQRFSTLAEMIRVFRHTEVSSVDWGGYTADVSSVKVAIIDRLVRLCELRWGPLKNVGWGPIAPSSALPVPSGPCDAQHLLDQSRFEMLAGKEAADRVRWRNPGSYKLEWEERAAIAAPLVPSGAFVLEVGCGAGALGRLLKGRCRYVGADLEPLDDSTYGIDLDRDPLPHLRYDCIVMLGVLEYLYRPLDVLAKLTQAADVLVLSYCCVTDSQLVSARAARGWCNAFTEAQLVQHLEALNFNMSQRRVFQVNTDFEQVIFGFSKKQ